MKKDEKFSKKIENSEKLYNEHFPSLSILKEVQSSGRCKCKVLRSASSWSIGLSSESTESSIYNEYIQLIENSKKFIYIENQFFISNTGSNNPIIENKYFKIELLWQSSIEFIKLIVKERNGDYI